MRLYRVTMIGVLVVLIWGCTTSGETPSGSVQPDAATRELAAAFRDSMPSVMLVSLDTTYRQGEPIRLVYFVANPGRAIAFNNDPGLVQVRLEHADGKPLSPSFSAGAVTGAWGPSVEMTLPSRGLVGRVVDLGCITTREVNMRGGMPECSYGFVNLSPGAYRAILELPVDALARRTDTAVFNVESGK